MNSLKLFLIGLALLGSQLIYAQNIVIFQQAQQMNILLNNNYVQMTRNENVKQILQSLSAEIPKSIYYTEYTVNFNYEMRLLQTFGTAYNILLSRRPCTVNGDVQLGSFRVDEVLVPDVYSFDLQIVLNNGFVRWSQHYQNISANQDGIIISANYYDTLNIGGSMMRMNNLQLGYSQQAIQRFNNKLQLIKSYKQLNATYYSNRLRQLPWDNVDSLGAIRDAYSQAQFYSNEMSSVNFQSLGSDPDGKLQSLNELSNLLGQYGPKMNALQREAPALYYQRGMAQMYAGNLDGAQKSFDMCLGSNKISHIPAVLQLAKIDFKLSRYDSCWDKLSLINQRMPDSLKLEMTRLGNDLYMVYLNQSKNLINKKLYKDAIAKLSNARNPCYTFNLVGCSDTCALYNKLAWMGIYNQYISEANAALKLNNYSLAEEKAEDAKRTARNNPKEITDTKKADEILGKLKQSQYDSYISNGKSNAASDKIETALTNYESAFAMQEKYILKVNNELPKLLKSTRKTVYYRRLVALKNGMSTMSLANAKKQYDEITREVIKASLENDADIKKICSDMSSKLGNKECEEAKANIISKMQEAKSQATNNSFILANTLYKTAIDSSIKFKYCGIDTVEIGVEIRRIMPGVKYDELLEQAKKQLEQNNYDQVNTQLDNIISFHQSQNLSALGVKVLNKEEWTNTSSDAFFHYYMSDYYLNKTSDDDAAFRLLKSSINNGMPVKLTKDLQKRIGVAMANKDHRTKSNSPQIWVTQHIKEMPKQLKEFKKAYEKQWKVLSKK